MGRTKKRIGKRKNLNDRFHKSKGLFDNLKSTAAIMEASVEESVEQLKEVSIQVDKVNRVGHMTIYGVDTPFHIGKKLGEGSFGAVYELSGSLDGTVLKVVGYDPRDPDNASYEDWVIRIVSEAALTRIFSAVKAGPTTPPISLGMSPDKKVAYFFMESMAGSGFDLMEAILYNGDFNKFKSTLTKQIRHHITVAVKLGIVCTDMKPDNMLYRITDKHKLKIVLADFDSLFCCALAESYARKHLHGVKMAVPDRKNDGHWTNIHGTLLHDRIPETGAPCPTKRNKYTRQIIKVTLGLIGSMMNLFPEERRYTRKYLGDRRNRGEYVFDLFKIRWDHYKPLFIV
uniref:Protein kinase domain-containing protein n=1 Tax=viral metagenome TaxID=1070528 RepID=A0A6C0LRA3_9ZZZZ